MKERLFVRVYNGVSDNTRYYETILIPLMNS